MKSLLIIGAGSFSAEVEALAKLLGYTEAAILDNKVTFSYRLYEGYWLGSY